MRCAAPSRAAGKNHTYMDVRYRWQAYTGLSISLPLLAVGVTLLVLEIKRTVSHFSSGVGLAAIIITAVALPFYVWGCAAFAKAKGYTRAILITLILGGLAPFVIVLVLPDKLKDLRRRR